MKEIVTVRVQPRYPPYTGERDGVVNVDVTLTSMMNDLLYHGTAAIVIHISYCLRQMARASDVSEYSGRMYRTS
jgi:hypothetical protein